MASRKRSERDESNKQPEATRSRLDTNVSYAVRIVDDTREAPLSQLSSPVDPEQYLTVKFGDFIEFIRTDTDEVIDVGFITFMGSIQINSKNNKFLVPLHNDEHKNNVYGLITSTGFIFYYMYVDKLPDSMKLSMSHLSDEQLRQMVENYVFKMENPFMQSLWCIFQCVSEDPISDLVNHVRENFK